MSNSKEPKFNIGQEVFFLSPYSRKIESIKIAGILKDAGDNYRYTTDIYGLVRIDGDSFKDDRTFFATKEALIASL